MIEVIHAECSIDWSVAIDIMDSRTLKGVRLRHDLDSSSWFIAPINRNPNSVIYSGENTVVHSENEAIDTMLRMFFANVGG